MKPNGDGTYKGVPPCARCGCTAFLLFEDRSPECLRCFSKKEAAEVIRLRMELETAL